MFSKELENLIQATLEDGVLEENEKAALIKRAQNEGVDLAELEIYINSILQRRQRELNNEKQKLAEAYKKEKKEAIGPVCPNCGKQIPPMALRCECGYEFVNNKEISSVQKLFDEINNVKLSKDEMESCRGITNDFQDAHGNWKSNYRQWKINALIGKKKASIILSFPVPNTKEAIIEFMSMATANSQTKGGLWGERLGRVVIASIISIIIFLVAFLLVDDGFFMFLALIASIIVFYFIFHIGTDILIANDLARTWRKKFEQILLKGRSLRGDNDFQNQLSNYEKLIGSLKWYEKF